MEQLKIKLDKHRFHIKKLETLLRMLDNMSVEVEQVGAKSNRTVLSTLHVCMVTL